jgi:hypothetical protein
MRKTSLLVFAFIAVLSCSKDGASLLNSPSTYFKSRIDGVGTIRVFTNTGEVKTAGTVNRFKAIDSNWYTTLTNDLIIYRGKLDSFRIIDPKNMGVNDNFLYSSYSVTAKGENITLTAKDTTTGIVYDEVFSRNLYYHLSFYKPLVFNEYLFTSTGGFYGFQYSTLKQFFLIQGDNLLKVPWVLAVVHKANGSIKPVQLQNKADFNFYKNLNTGDTVSIREYEISYGK